MKARKEKATNSPITTFFKKLAPSAKPKRLKVNVNQITTYFSKRTALAPLNTSTRSVQQVKKPQPDSPVISVAPHLPPPGSLPARSLQEGAKSPSSQLDGFVIIPTPGNLPARSLQEGAKSPLSQLDGFVIIPTPPGNLPARRLQGEAKSPSSELNGFVIISTPPGNLPARRLQGEAKCPSSQPDSLATSIALHLPPGNIPARSLQEGTRCPSSHPDSLVTSIAPHLPPPGNIPAVKHSSDQDSSLFNVTAPQLIPLPTKLVSQPSPVLSTVPSLNTPTMPGNAVKNCQGDPETDTILITDSSLLSDCSVVDLTHDNPSPKKRVCLIDLTESPPSLLTPSPVAVNKSEESHTVDERRQQSTDTVAQSGGEEERTESSSTVMASVSLSAVAEKVESFHLTMPTNLQLTSGPEPMVVEQPVHTMSKCPSPTQVQLVTASSPLLTSLFLSSDHTDVFDLLVPPCSLQEELEPLLWQRGIPYSKIPTGKVRLFSTVQDNIVDNLLELTSAVTSRKLHSVLEYLTLTTTATIMPRGSILQRLWEMVADPHVAVNCLSTDSMLRCITFLRRLLSLHPPGQHPLVDTQYREFVRSLGEAGGPFATWEWINGMISGPELCAQLLSFLVDLFLSDFWTCLTSKKEPLFVKVFWLGSGSGSGHVTLPIRRLVDASVQLVEKPGYQDSELSKLGSCTSLLFLAATRCQDLSTELATACRRLPSDKLLLFISHLQPISLQVKLLQQTNTAPRLQLILSSVAKQLPSNSTEKEQHIPHQQEREEGHTTSAQQPRSQQEREEGHTTSVQQPRSQQEREEGHTTSAQQPRSQQEREEGHTTSAQQPRSQQEREEGHTTSAQQPRSQQEREEGHTTSAQQPRSQQEREEGHTTSAQQPRSQQEREEGHTTSAQQPRSQQEREEGHTTSAQQPRSQQEREEGHTTSAQQPRSMKLDVNTSKTDGGQSTKVQSPPCAIVLSQPVSRSVLKADLKIATLNSNKAQHSNTTSLASNRFVAPPVRIHGQPNPKAVALSSMRRRPQGGPISHCRPTPLPTKAPATQPNPKTVALSSTQRRPQGGSISHCRPTPLPTKTPATQPNPKTVALSSAQRRPQGGPISHCRPAPLPTKTPATQSSSVKGLAHQCTTLSARSLSAIHKASTSSSSLQAKRFLSGTHSSKVTAK